MGKGVPGTLAFPTLSVCLCSRLRNVPPLECPTTSQLFTSTAGPSHPTVSIQAGTAAIAASTSAKPQVSTQDKLIVLWQATEIERLAAGRFHELSHWNSHLADILSHAQGSVLHMRPCQNKAQVVPLSSSLWTEKLCTERPWCPIARVMKGRNYISNIVAEPRGSNRQRISVANSLNTHWCIGCSTAVRTAILMFPGCPSQHNGNRHFTEVL